MNHLTNAQVHQLLKDATEEASRIDSATTWNSIGNNWWTVHDADGHLLGWVDASINCCNGMAVFRYKSEATYRGIQRVADVSVDPMRLTDSEELQKLTDFDSEIVRVHRL